MTEVGLMMELAGVEEDLSTIELGAFVRKFRGPSGGYENDADFEHPAVAQGVMIGDTIVGIGSQNVEKMPFEQIISVIKALPLEKVILRFRRFHTARPTQNLTMELSFYQKVGWL